MVAGLQNDLEVVELNKIAYYKSCQIFVEAGVPEIKPTVFNSERDFV